MFRINRLNQGWRWCLAALVVTSSVVTAHGQSASEALPAPELKEVFNAAWARQPEARAYSSHEQAVQAQQRAATAWTAAPPAFDFTSRTDQWSRNQGLREQEYGLVAPIWLPGERRASAALAEAQATSLQQQTQAARLRVAGQVRELWWTWQRTRIDVALTRDQCLNAQRISADVAKRVQAGDLARADQHQADGAAAAAQAALAQAQADEMQARQQLNAATGLRLTDNTQPDSQAESETALTLQGVSRILRDQALPIHFKGDGKALASLAVGQPVKIFVQSRSTVPGRRLSASALTKNSANQPIVWVKTDAERFEPRAVISEPLDGASVAILSGLEEGARVVTQGATLINQVR